MLGWVTKANQVYFTLAKGGIIGATQQFNYLKQMHAINIILFISTSVLIAVRVFLFRMSDQLINTCLERFGMTEDKCKRYGRYNFITMLSSMVLTVCSLYFILAGYHRYGWLENNPNLSFMVSIVGLIVWVYSAIKAYKYGKSVFRGHNYVSDKMKVPVRFCVPGGACIKT